MEFRYLGLPIFGKRTFGGVYTKCGRCIGQHNGLHIDKWDIQDSRLAPHTNIRVSSPSVHLLRSLSNTLEKQYSICEQMANGTPFVLVIISNVSLYDEQGDFVPHCPFNVKVIVNTIPYFQIPQGSSLGPPGSQFPVEHYQDHGRSCYHPPPHLLKYR